MKKIDYKKLTEITVKSQEELDMIPLDFKGRIYIEFGDYYNSAIINNCYKISVVARGNSRVEARGNSSVVAWENSSVEAWESSSVEAWENSRVEAWENSRVVARGNVQVLDCLNDGKIEINGNARIVHNPKTIREFMDFYGIKHDKKKAIFYKAVHKRENFYFSDHDHSFLYNIGRKIKVKCDIDTDLDCSFGIHISHLDWALKYGRDWHDLAILEVETDIDKIVLPKNSDGKVRTSEITVLREVPLGECGLYGQILANERGVK